jgi:putative IMPACT (imprinted ancient) family translation regulator
MGRYVGGILSLLFSVLPAAGGEGRDKPATPAEQFKAIVSEFYDLTHVHSFKAETDAERAKAVERMDRLRLRCLELAEKNPKDAIARDALTQVVTVETWLENNTAHPGWGKDSAGPRAVVQLLRDHGRSDKLGEPCRRIHYGFRKEYETFLRTVLKENPHQEVQALTCLYLAQFLSVRLQRLDLIGEQPEIAKRYEGLFGKDYLEALRKQDRAEATAEIESLFERAVKEFGEVKLSPGGTVGAQAKAALHEIRNLSVGKTAQDIEGEDQDGKRFKLSDYRGKVVLLYFWSQY